MAQQILGTNTFTTAKWIVSATASDGTHTTIASALTSASSGDTIFIRPGTYTENITLKAGANLTAYGCDSGYLGGSANVIINGTCSYSSAGTVTISGIMLQTNGATALLSITGSAASIVILNNCNINCTANTGITFSTANTSAYLSLLNCTGNLGTTGIAFFSDSSTGTTRITNCVLGNSGGSSTANTTSAGIIGIINSQIYNPLTYSSSSTGSQIFFSQLDSNLQNATPLTTSGTGTINCLESYFAAGSASAISIGSGTTVSGYTCTISSSNTNAITGAGTSNLSELSFSSTSKIINTTTQTWLNSSTFTPVLQFGGANVGITYTSQYGKYYRQDNVCFFSIFILLSSKGSSTGNATITGMPFAIAGDGGNYVFPMAITTGGAAAVQFAYGNLTGSSPTTLTLAYEIAGTATLLTNANFNNTTELNLDGFYFI